MKIAYRFLVPSIIIAALLVVNRRKLHESDGTIPEASNGRPDFWASVVVREGIARDVAAGRCSLCEAAGLFRKLNNLVPGIVPASHQDPAGPKLRIPLDTEEGRLCRQVVSFTYGMLREDGLDAFAEAVARRLDEEFQEEMRKWGAIRIAEPANPELVNEMVAKARRDRMLP